MEWLAIACGGACGAVLRYATTLVAVHWCGDRWPWGTLAANLAGCLALGLFSQHFAVEHFPRWADWQHTPCTATSTRHVSVWRTAE